jgi:hypothetical protein
MTTIDALTEYLAPAAGSLELCLGKWDESPGEEATEFLSIVLEPGARPDVIATFAVVDLWLVSVRGVNDIAGGKMEWYRRCNGILQYILDNPSSSCFANIIPIAGMIGPMTSEEHRAIYKITIELTQ